MSNLPKNSKALAWGPARPPTQRFFVLRGPFAPHRGVPGSALYFVVAAYCGLFGFELC